MFHGQREFMYYASEYDRRRRDAKKREKRGGERSVFARP